MIFVKIFLAFLIANLLGYGGGPSVIPLIKNEVVDVYGWMSSDSFAEVLAIGNMLPGPINTKMAGYIGYQQGGFLGIILALAATALPSLVVMIALMRTILRYKHSPRVQNMTLLIQPAVAAMLLMMALEFFASSWAKSGMLNTAVIAIGSFIAMERFKIHPFFAIIAALIYGFLFI